MCCISAALGSRYASRSWSATSEAADGVSWLIARGLRSDMDLCLARDPGDHVASPIVVLGPRKYADAGSVALDDLRAPLEREIQHLPDEVRRDPVVRERDLAERPAQAFGVPLLGARLGLALVGELPALLPGPRI